MAHQCIYCEKIFSAESSKTRHEKNSCPLRPQPTAVKAGHLQVIHDPWPNVTLSTQLFPPKNYSDIIEALPTISQKYRCAQRFGVFYRGVYPLIFPKKKDDPSLFHLEKYGSFLAHEEHLKIILKEQRNEPIIICKSIKIVTETGVIDLSSMSIPINAKKQFIIKDMGDFVLISRNYKRSANTPASLADFPVSGSPIRNRCNCPGNPGLPAGPMGGGGGGGGGGQFSFTLLDSSTQLWPARCWL
jgi:hypothetical protein